MKETDMRIAVLAIIAMLPAAAQEIKMPPSLDRLAAKASEVVDVNLDSSLLQLAGKFISDKGDEAKTKKLVSGLKNIYVKSFQFDRPGEYDPADLEPVRLQLRTPAWSRIVGVQSRKRGENTEVYLKNENGKVVGVAIIAAEPRELTIVNIVGTIDPDQLQDLGGHFGIPNIDKRTDRKDD
jgi:hypothetical protein